MNYEEEILSKEKYNNYVIGADIGGTNTRIAVAGIKNKLPVIIKIYKFKTKKLKSLYEAIDIVLKGNKNIKSMCIGAAGSVKDNKVKLTNAKLIVDRNRIEKKYKKKTIILNDFELIGWGVNIINQKKTLTIQKGKQNKIIAIIGAGTGLGKSILVKYDKYYVPYSSEGGHTDVPVKTKEELDLVKSIGATEYEHLLSGKGIQQIYKYYTKKNKTPEEIIKKDHKKTMNTFLKFYARCVKNFALDTLSSTVYIAGGIAINNPNIFKNKIFLKELHNNKTQKEILKKIEIKIIKDQNISLYGACFRSTLQ